MIFETRFDRGSRSMAIRLTATEFEPVPFVDELRFWGVDRKPCAMMAALASCILASRLPVVSVQLPGVVTNSYFCSQIRQAFDFDIHPGAIDDRDRRLLGGDNTVLPYRFADGVDQEVDEPYYEPLSWTGVADFRGTIGGTIRSNIDVFELTDLEKDAITALCCGGESLGFLLLPQIDQKLGTLFHNLGLGVAAA